MCSVSLKMELLSFKSGSSKVASQRAYGRFLFWGVGEGVGFVFSSVEFQSNQHLGCSLKKRRKTLYLSLSLSFSLFLSSSHPSFFLSFFLSWFSAQASNQRHPKGKSRYSSNSEHLTFILTFNREMLYRSSRCQRPKGNCSVLSFQRWANLGKSQVIWPVHRSYSTGLL